MSARHRIHINAGTTVSTGATRYVAECRTCGWIGPERARCGTAERDGEDHARGAE